MSKIGILLSLTAACLQIFLITIFVRRKLYQEFPFFLAYITASVFIAVVRLSVSNDRAVYFYVYWATEAVYAILGILVLHQVFRRVFNEFYSHWPRFWLFFPVAAGVITIIAVWYGVRYAPKQPYFSTTVVLIAGTAVNFMQAGLFGLFFLLVRFFALRWRNHAFAIVLGFALAAIGSWGSYWLYSETETRYIFLAYGSAISYICAVLLWLIVFSRPEPKQDWSLTIRPEELLQEVRECAKMLKSLRRR